LVVISKISLEFLIFQGDLPYTFRHSYLCFFPLQVQDGYSFSEPHVKILVLFFLFPPPPERSLLRATSPPYAFVSGLFTRLLPTIPPRPVGRFPLFEGYFFLALDSFPRALRRLSFRSFFRETLSPVPFRLLRSPPCLMIGLSGGRFLCTSPSSPPGGRVSLQSFPSPSLKELFFFPRLLSVAFLFFHHLPAVYLLGSTTFPHRRAVRTSIKFYSVPSSLPSYDGSLSSSDLFSSAVPTVWSVFECDPSLPRLFRL